MTLINTPTYLGEGFLLLKFVTFLIFLRVHANESHYLASVPRLVRNLAPRF